MKAILLLFLLNILLVACQTFKEAGSVLRNEKKNSTDEFLIQKLSKFEAESYHVSALYYLRDLRN